MFISGRYVCSFNTWCWQQSAHWMGFTTHTVLTSLQEALFLTSTSFYPGLHPGTMRKRRWRASSGGSHRGGFESSLRLHCLCGLGAGPTLSEPQFPTCVGRVILSPTSQSSSKITCPVQPGQQWSSPSSFCFHSESKSSWTIHLPHPLPPAASTVLLSGFWGFGVWPGHQLDSWLLPGDPVVYCASQESPSSELPSLSSLTFCSALIVTSGGSQHHHTTPLTGALFVWGLEGFAMMASTRVSHC